MSDKWLWENAKPTLSAAGLAHPHEFDIHGGGIDLVFPHHENEIAQSRCAHGTAVMANYWMHNGFLQVEGEKMAKSAGNFVTIRELLETEKFGGRSWSGEVLRLAMLKTHYRQPIDWTVRGLEEARQILHSWSDAIRHIGLTARPGAYAPPPEATEALSDDLNTSGVVTLMHGLARASRKGDTKAAEHLAGAAELVGLSWSMWDPEGEKGLFEYGVDPAFSDNVDNFIAARAAARAEKNWAKADEIRDQLDAMGIALKDAKDPETGELVTTWEVKR